ncbi:hypothetical protein MN116_001053 [Schistosoma mekongi]|uniref:beta-N-acetylhexosaminidase n=1 Tax=Schistosoma mekongi TaxID=38744 RepID=A0AAE2D996_SCHME|nr:hypothetical protein MN116_001053 [Schistosoma mekongi]
MGHSSKFQLTNIGFTDRLLKTFLLHIPVVFLSFIVSSRFLGEVTCTNTTNRNDTDHNDDAKVPIDQLSAFNVSHLESSSPNDIILENTWRYRLFPSLKIPVFRSPHPTFGSPWPLPHSWSTTSCYYNVDITDFHFEFHRKNSNKILQSAINRYMYIIQNKLGFSVYPKVWQHDEERLFSYSFDNYQLKFGKTVVKRSQDTHNNIRNSHSSFRADSSYSRGTINDFAYNTAIGIDAKTGNDLSHFVSQKISRLIHKYGLSPHRVLRNGTQKYALLHVVNSDSKLPHANMDESYILGVSENGIFIVANETWGALRALETLSQLMWTTRGPSHVFINKTYIEDFPRFKHRGLMLDTSRHFLSKSVILLNLEAMSYNKLNVLHWHIVDDQSFPYQSSVYPELSAMGAYREDLVYTPSDIKEILEFARFRGIRVIPEFDIPGHTRSISLSHPEIMSQCQHYSKGYGYYGPLNPATNKTYTFLENLLGEVFKLFLDDYIHLGGDEVETECWGRDPEIQHSVENPGHFSSEFWINYFWRRVQNLVTYMGQSNPQLKRDLILWQDALRHVTELKKSLLVQVWYSQPQSYLSQGYNIIYSSCWYLDSLHDMRDWTKFYQCDPADNAPLNTEKQIIGGEACLWSEYQSDYTVLTRIWPATSAVAERLWSSKEVTDLKYAGPRIEEQRCRLINRGIPAGVLLGPGYCENSSLIPMWNMNELLYIRNIDHEDQEYNK